jgi:hypothetical protein
MRWQSAGRAERRGSRTMGRQGMGRAERRGSRTMGRQGMGRAERRGSRTTGQQSRVTRLQSRARGGQKSTGGRAMRWQSAGRAE